MFVITPSDVKLMLNYVITHYKKNHPFPLVILGEELTECGLTVEGLTNFNISLPNNVDAEIAYVKLFHFLFRMATVRLMGLPMDDTNYKARCFPFWNLFPPLQVSPRASEQTC